METLTSSILPFHPHSHSHPHKPPWYSSQTLKNVPYHFLLPPLPTSSSSSHTLVLHRTQAAARKWYDFDLRTLIDDEDDEDVEFSRRARKRRGSFVKKRRWWSDEESEGDILEQAVDNLFILQVFRSYGLFLPVILLSMLLATGPKAFLMGSGIPFGLSVLFFAFKKLSGWVEGTPKPRRKRRSRSRFSRKKYAFTEDADELKEENQQGRSNKKRAYKSRVAQEDRTVYNRSSDNRLGVNGFGGWDDLVSEVETESRSRPSQAADTPDMMTEKEKFSSFLLKQKESPLLLRLLVAIFPFLGSWTSLL